jgi:maltose alpha-D-glucosyltransferase/alpha-amylase
VNVSTYRAAPDSILNVIRHMISVRKQHQPFGRGQFLWLDLENTHLAAFQRTYQGETILAIHNLNNQEQRIMMPMKNPVPSMTDLLTKKEFYPANEALEIKLEPYQYLWLE